MVLKDSTTSGYSGSGGGVTWAFEVGGQTMVCPIIVEDLSPPGQMLIEVCKRQTEEKEFPSILVSTFNILNPTESIMI